MSIVTIENVAKTYGGCTALESVDLTVPRGKCLALIGHNGAGKTTLMKLMLGLARPTRGRVSVLGVDPAGADKHFRSRLGFLPENVAFHDELTGLQTLAFYARLKGLPTACCDALLERVGLSSASGRRVKTYSKGMRQRLGLAQALLGAPRLLLLDEPTVGLDPVLRHEFFRIVEELTAQGTTVILSSHILTELEARTDLAAIMRQGRLVAFGDLDGLRREAGLPVKIRARGDAGAIARRLNGAFVKAIEPDQRSIEIDCPVGGKMALVRTLADLGEVCSDLEVRPPSLDDLYLHYSGGAISAAGEPEATR
jgi:Cu-processing system ATP-binding protein